MKVFRGLFLVAITLSILMAGQVFARELSATALAKIQPQVLESFLNAGDRELIFLLDDNAVARQARLSRLNRGLSFEDRVIVREKSLAYRDIKKRILKHFDQNEVQQLKSYNSLPMMFARVASPEVLRQLLENENIVQVFRNSRLALALAESLPLIGQPESYTAGHGGQGTTVAVLDSGADYTRSAFGSCVEPGVPDDCKVIFARDFTNNDDGMLDPHGHGTNVSAIVLGVAPDTKIAALDVFVGNFLYVADAIAAIDWVVANQSVYNIVAMNLSFGTGLYDEICDQSWATVPFAHARAVGVSPVTASGNDADKAKLLSPACAPGAIRVGAVHDKDVGVQSFRWCSDNTTEPDLVACYSNSAEFLDLLAPGTLITAGEITLSGTSMATAHVSGAVAVLKGESAYPGDDIESTLARLKNSGKQVLDSRNGFMFPRIDLEAALIELLPDQVPEISRFEPVVAAEGEVMQIHGSGFRGVDEVLIGDVPVSGFAVETTHLITANIGPGSSGAVHVATSVGSDSLPGFTFVNSYRETEPNNSMDGAEPVNFSHERLSGALSDQHDVDVFRFGFDTGDVSFGIRPVMRGCCDGSIYARLVDGQGVVLASARIDESANGHIFLEATITERGAYYLVFSESPEGDAVFVHDYQVKVPENAYQNMDPTFTSSPPDVVFMGQTYRYSLQAFDPDNDPVYFTIKSAPPGLVLDQASKSIRWQPQAGQAGLNDVELMVFDDFGGSELQTFSVAVIDHTLLDVTATDGIFKNTVRVQFNLIDGASAYRVFRCADATTPCGSPIGFTRKGYFNDTRAIPGVLYHYRVRACSANKCTTPSDPDAGYAGIAPEKPTGIRASDGTFDDRVLVTFNPVVDASVYRVFRCLDRGQTCGSPIGFPQENSFDDKRGGQGTIYFYRVKACNSQHCGKFSVANSGYKTLSSSANPSANPDTHLRGYPTPIPMLGEAGKWLMVLFILALIFFNRTTPEYRFFKDS